MRKLNFLKMKNFNIIEYSPQYNKEDNALICWYNSSSIKIYQNTNYKNNFIKDLVGLKSKFITFFINDSTTILPFFLNSKIELKNYEIKTFMVKSSVYSFTLHSSTDNKFIKFISLSKQIPYFTEEKDYTNQPFWSDGGGLTTPAEKEARLTTALKISKNNCLSIYRILSEFNNKIIKLESKWYKFLSISSISKKIFEDHFNTYNLNIENSVCLDLKLRTAFYGGRCEIFGNPYKNELIYHYDFAHMYGQIMLEKYPTGTLSLHKEKITSFEKYGFYYIIASSNMEIPILPHRTNNFNLQNNSYDEEEVIFSNGSFEGLYYKEEIDYFLKNKGKIIDIKYAYIFEPSRYPTLYKLDELEYLFKDFAEFFIDLKIKDNKKLWKAILVSFYGRLGMKPHYTETILLKEEDYDKNKKNYQIVNEIWIKNYVIIEIEKAPNKIDSLVQYASIIASKARIKLHKNLIQVIQNNGRLLYTDTDSIFAAYTKNVDNEKHGDIKWENKNIKDAAFLNVRNYSIQYETYWETKIAGIDRNSVTFDKIKENLYLNRKWDIFYKSRYHSIFKEKSWEKEDQLHHKNYSKRVFSLDKKKTRAWYKEDDKYL